MFKPDLNSHAITPTPGLAQHHLEEALVSQVPSLLVDWSYTEEIPIL